MPVLRLLRASAPLLVAALGLAIGGGGLAPERVDIPGSYLTAQPSDAGLPAGLGAARGLEGQAPERGRGGPAGARRGAGSAPPAPGTAAVADAARLPAAPDGLADRALERAGRVSDPSTAPPILS